MESKLGSLKKDTLSNTYEHINRFLLRDREHWNNWIKFSSVMNTANSFDTSIKLIIIDTIKFKEGVIEALLSNDLQQIRRALHCKWFYEDAVPPETYFIDILPKVSCSTRCKIINQLSKHIKSEENAEKFFKFIGYNYGRSHSVMLLPKCRPEFISLYLKDNDVSFNYVIWRRLLMKLAPRYPQIVFSILEKWCDGESPFHDKLCKCSKLILYLAKRFPELFLQFFEKHYSSLLFLHFGDKLRRNLSPALLDIVLKSERALKWRMFNEKNLFKELDFKGKVDFLAKIISPKKETSFSSWYSGISKILPFIRLRPAYERAELLDAIFKKVFEKNLWEHPELWQPPMLELMPLEIREKCVFILTNDQKFAAYRYKMTSLDRGVADQLAYLQDCGIAIPKLKEMIKRTQSAEDREIILEEMVKSCAINQDLQSLEDVCSYVKNRHLNEDPSTITSFLATINYSFNTQKFNLSLWTVIEELFTICLNINAHAYNVYLKMIEKYVIFRLNNKMDPNEQIHNLVKYLISYERNIFISNVRSASTSILFRAYYDEFIRIMDSEGIEKSTIRFLCEVILKTMNEHNVCHKKNKISPEELKRLVFHLDNLFENFNPENVDFNSILLSVLEDSYLKERYKHKIYKKEYESDLLCHLKKNPNYIVENSPELFDYLLKGNNKRFLQNISVCKKVFDFYNLSEKFKNVTAEEFKQIKSDGNFRGKYHSLLLYSHFANILEYESLIQDYLPKDEKLNNRNCSEEFILIQKIIPKLIKNIKPQSKNFSLIFKFLLGDFLKFVLGSFDSACFNSPVETVMSVLNEKIDSPISVKKAILRNISAVCTLQERIKFCNDLWEKEKHDSIRTVIFKRMSENFLDEPTEESFASLKNCIMESSEVMIKSRFKILAIPTRFRNDYACAIWDYTDKIFKNDNLKNQMKNSLIEEFSLLNINILSDELCEKIIKSGIFNDDSQVKLNSFACYYLVSDPESVKRKLDTLLNLMLERKQNPNSIVSFLNVLGRFSLEHPKHFHEIFDGLVTAWPKIFTKYELFDEFLTVQYYKAYHKSLINEDFKNILNVTIKFAEELKKIIRETNDCLELLIIFRMTIQKFLKKIIECNCPLDDILMIRQLITPPERELAIIGILLLPNENLKESEVGEWVEDEVTLDRNKNIQYIIRTLKNFKDDSVQVYYYRRFNLKKIKK